LLFQKLKQFDMDFSSLTFYMTGDCNYDCSYCYQKKDKKYLDLTTAKKAVEFLLPVLTQECSINFYGGEPLLASDKIREVVQVIQDKNKRLQKKISFSLSTNGSLVDDDVLEFLDRNKFTVLLSFDGLAQNVSRKKGSFAQIVSVLKRLLRCSHIELETNSVFTSETVEYLWPSMRFIIESGVRSAGISLSNHLPWSRPALISLGKELSQLRRFLFSFYKETRVIPVFNFQKVPRDGVFGCLAGKDRIAISPDGRLWGCCLFYDFYRKKENRNNLRYCFGSLDSFIKNHERIYPEVLDSYANLHMKSSFTSQKFCALCEEVEDCAICPVDAGFASSIIGKISDWDCAMRRIIRKEKQRLAKEIEKYNRWAGRRPV
jgi:sulfatase maturation enzyme AslB (radical SAM superfamily)